MKMDLKVLRFRPVPPHPPHRGEGILVRVMATALDDSGVPLKSPPRFEGDTPHEIFVEIEEVVQLSAWPFGISDTPESFVRRVLSPWKERLKNDLEHRLSMAGLGETRKDIPETGKPFSVEI